MREIVVPLMKWYQENKRDLPWRKDKDPYHIWISEIMLQQTRVEAVKNYYQRFMREVPDIISLAQMEEDNLLKLWEGLGYYTRAKNLKKAAIQIVEKYHGNFPTTYEELLSLPGIGEYTAGAIASIAFEKPVPAIDGNVVRVMLRLKNSKKEVDSPKLKKELFLELKEILPKESGDFNQAMMDLGATICIPNAKPSCEKCPLQAFCKAHLEKNTLNIPVKKHKVLKKKEQYTIVILEHDEEVALHKRPAKGLLANLYEFYTIPEQLTLKQLKQHLLQKNMKVLKVQKLAPATHIFTHKIWQMQGYAVQIDQKVKDFEWTNKKDLLEKYSIPSAFFTYKSYISNQLEPEKFKNNRKKCS